MRRIPMEDTTSSVVKRGVLEIDQTMTLEKVFWSHFSPNLIPGNWIIGILLVGIGLDFWTGMFAIVLGNILGSLPVALAALIGPKTGLPQIEASRFAFGHLGVRVPAFLNWVYCIGWDAVNNVTSTLALMALLSLVGVQLPFWFILAILVAMQMFIAFYGHHLVQVIEKYLGYFLLVMFVLIGALAIAHGGAVVSTGKPISLSTITLGVALVTSGNLSWVTYSSDYTRYLPKNTSEKKIFWLAFLGIAISAGALQFFGLMTASAIGDPTPNALISSIGKFTGILAPVALIALGISCIPNNALNDNTAAYSLISSGIRIPRPASAIAAAVLGFIVAVYGAGQFALFLQNYLLVLLYWLAPWTAIVLTHWYMSGQMASQTPLVGWTGAATVFILVTVLTTLLFASTQVYTGPVARLLGGTDIGYFVGFFVSAILYTIILRSHAARSSDV